MARDKLLLTKCTVDINRFPLRSLFTSATCGKFNLAWCWSSCIPSCKTKILVCWNKGTSWQLTSAIYNRWASRGQMFQEKRPSSQIKPSTILSCTDSFLMYLLAIAYARASIKKGPNSTIGQRGNLPTEFFPKIQGRLMALWDAIVTMKATKLVARKGSITILMPISHKLTDVTRKAVAAMPVTLDIPIAIFYN